MTTGRGPRKFVIMVLSFRGAMRPGGARRRSAGIADAFQSSGCLPQCGARRSGGARCARRGAVCRGRMGADAARFDLAGQCRSRGIAAGSARSPAPAPATPAWQHPRRATSAAIAATLPRDSRRGACSSTPTSS